MATGEASASVDALKQTRADARVINDALDAREQELEAREKVLATTTAQFVDFVGKSVNLFDRLSARLDNIEREREKEQQEPLPEPPGEEPEDEPKADADPDESADPVPPTGELHDLPPKQLADPVTDQWETEFPVDPELPEPPQQRDPAAIEED
jgi:hypothetical protein